MHSSVQSEYDSSSLMHEYGMAFSILQVLEYTCCKMINVGLLACSRIKMGKVMRF